MTIKEIRKEMRELKESEVIIVDGWGQIKKIGKEYAIGPLSEEAIATLIQTTTLGAMD